MTERSEKPDGALYLRWLKEEGVGEILPDAAPLSSSPAAPIAGQSVDWDSLRQQALQCVRCSELAATRKQVVFGDGNLQARLMFVGEAPGQEEDLQGLPFVGAAGQLLTKIIQSIGFERNQVYIANVLKCRPPQNRPPRPEEISNCRPYLDHQIAFIKPRILCALGTFAAQTLLKTDTAISKLRGVFHACPGFPDVKVMCTYHPAYLLRNPSEKRKVWEDMKKIRAELGD